METGFTLRGMCAMSCSKGFTVIFYRPSGSAWFGILPLASAPPRGSREAAERGQDSFPCDSLDVYYCYIHM